MMVFLRRREFHAGFCRCQVPLAIRAATQAGMLDALQTNNGLLDQIMKCLEAYLVSLGGCRVMLPAKW